MACFHALNDLLTLSTFYASVTHPVTNSTRRSNRGILSHMGKVRLVLFVAGPPSITWPAPKELRGGAYGSDSGLGKRDIDRDCGGGGGAVVGVAVVVEAVPSAAEARRSGVDALALLLLYRYRWRTSSPASLAS